MEHIIVYILHLHIYNTSVTGGLLTQAIYNNLLYISTTTHYNILLLQIQQPLQQLHLLYYWRCYTHRITYTTQHRLVSDTAGIIVERKRRTECVYWRHWAEAKLGYCILHRALANLCSGMLGEFMLPSLYLNTATSHTAFIINIITGVLLYTGWCSGYYSSLLTLSLLATTTSYTASHYTLHILLNTHYLLVSIYYTHWEGPGRHYDLCIIIGYSYATSTSSSSYTSLY